MSAVCAIVAQFNIRACVSVADCVCAKVAQLNMALKLFGIHYTHTTCYNYFQHISRPLEPRPVE